MQEGKPTKPETVAALTDKLMPPSVYEKQLRETKYTPENVREVIMTMLIGGTKQMAAEIIGIDQDTIRNWQKAHSDFSVSIKKAYQYQERTLLAKIAAVDDWKAWAWILERTKRDEKGNLRYALNTKISHEGEIKVKTETDEQTAKRFAAALNRAVTKGSSNIPEADVPTGSEQE